MLPSIYQLCFICRSNFYRSDFYWFSSFVTAGVYTSYTILLYSVCIIQHDRRAACIHFFIAPCIEVTQPPDRTNKTNFWPIVLCRGVSKAFKSYFNSSVVEMICTTLLKKKRGNNAGQKNFELYTMYTTIFFSKGSTKLPPLRLLLLLLYSCNGFDY